jgi:protein-tyrosine phosphatase
MDPSGEVEEMDIVAVNHEGTLFVSGEIEDWAVVKGHGIDTIVDMDGDVDPGLPEAPNQILYVYFPIFDEALPSLQKLDSVGRLVADLVGNEHRVLVHCRMGLNRSVLVIATALTYLGYSGERALTHLQEIRPGALYNEMFAEHVKTLPARRLRLELD